MFQRKDPAGGRGLRDATQILALCRRALVLNRPAGILAANEKLYALHFAELMPETLVARRSAQLRRLPRPARRRDDREAARRPRRRGRLPRAPRRPQPVLDPRADRRASARAAAMAQRYLPAVRSGDKRILLARRRAARRGAARARARARRAQPARRRHARGRPRSTTPTAGSSSGCAPWLARDGLYFVGIDVIGGLLTEVNVTSPTGVQEIERPRRRPLEERVLERVEATRSRAASERRGAAACRSGGLLATPSVSASESLLTPSERDGSFRACVGGSSPAPPTVSSSEARLPVAGKTQPTEKEWPWPRRSRRPGSSERRVGSTTSTRRAT